MKRFKTALWYMLGLLLAIIVTLIFFMFMASTFGYVENIAEFFNNPPSIMKFIRWLIIACIFIFYDNIINHLVNRKRITNHTAEIIFEKKWKYFATILAFDLIVIEAIPQQLITKIF